MDSLEPTRLVVVVVFNVERGPTLVVERNETEHWVIVRVNTRISNVHEKSGDDVGRAEVECFGLGAASIFVDDFAIGPPVAPLF